MKTHKLKVTLNEIKRMQELAGVKSLNEGKISINKKYTHFIVDKKSNRILNGFDYKGMDRESIKDYYNDDLEDMGLDKREVSLMTVQQLKKKGIDPFNTSSWKRNLKEGSYAQIAGVKSEFLNVEEIAKIADGMAEDLLDKMQGDYDVSREDGTASSYSSDIGKEFENSSREYAKNFVKDYGIMEDIMKIFDNVFDDFSSRTMD